MADTVDPIPSTKHYLAPWCAESDLPSGRLTDSNGAPLGDVPLGWMISAATDLLFVLSGRQFRVGRSIVRPTSIQGAFGNQSYLYPYSSMSGYGSAWGFNAGWAWTAIGMGWWQNGQDLAECVLQGPVRRINSVLVDGSELGGWAPGGPDNPNYKLFDRRRLVRMVDVAGASSGAWPWNQQLQLPVSMPGTWQIDYEWGLSPSEGGRLACAELAIELALGFSGQDSCKLPARVLSVATQGVTTAVGDPLTFLMEDLTGLPICDLFLRAYNPGKRRRRAVFLAPNSIQGRSS